MDEQGRRSPSRIKKTLLEEPRRFSFIQALRLLRRLVRGKTGREPEENALSRKIHVRPELSLDFPGTDITDIKEIDTDSGDYQVTATFLGLYGASSPLPSFYTEDLIDEYNEDRSITRDFLDIINSPFYDLLFQAWGKSQLVYQLTEIRDQRPLERLYRLLGLETDHFRRSFKDSYRLLRYIGLATQLPRSAEGLRAMLSDALGVIDIEVVPCVERMAAIPESQRLWLNATGNILGEDSVLGEQIADCTGKFRIRIGPTGGELLHAFLPDEKPFAEIAELVKFYLDQPFDWDLEIVLKPGEAQGMVLGQTQWSRLGWNTWLIATPPDETLEVQLEALEAL